MNGCDELPGASAPDCNKVPSPVIASSTRRSYASGVFEPKVVAYLKFIFTGCVRVSNPGILALRIRLRPSSGWIWKASVLGAKALRLGKQIARRPLEADAAYAAGRVRLPDRR